MEYSFLLVAYKKQIYQVMYKQKKLRLVSAQSEESTPFAKYIEYVTLAYLSVLHLRLF